MRGVHSLWSCQSGHKEQPRESAPGAFSLCIRVRRAPRGGDLTDSACWLQSSLTDAQRLLQQQGLDTNAVTGVTRTATAQASGIFDQVR
jgi:hypothetical protein